MAKRSPAPSPPRENSSGMMYSRASVIAMPRRSVRRIAPRQSSVEGPRVQVKAAQIPAVASSISGYWIEIGALHPLHFPPRKSQERTGMLSYHRSSYPHFGQRLPGRTTDCSEGRRRMQTFRKLPKMAPKRPPMTVRTGSPGTGTLPEEDGGRGGDVERLRTGGDRDRDARRGARGEFGADPRPLVAEEEGERAGGAPRLPDIGAVHRGAPERHLRPRAPLGELRFSRVEIGELEGSSHRPAQDLRVEELRTPGEGDHSRGAQGEGAPEDGAEVAGVLDGVEDQVRGTWCVVRGEIGQ